jgi:ElaB/YqjD/DUF883 family membrane-anchored ribosome-binding protein
MRNNSYPAAFPVSGQFKKDSRMRTLSKIRDDLEGVDLEAEVAALRKEMTRLSRFLSKRGLSAYEATRETGGDIYADAWERFNDALPHIRKQARAVEKTARDHPATAAVVGLVVIGLLASLLSRR